MLASANRNGGRGLERVSAACSQAPVRAAAKQSRSGGLRTASPSPAETGRGRSGDTESVKTRQKALRELRTLASPWSGTFPALVAARLAALRFHLSPLGRRNAGATPGRFPREVPRPARYAPHQAQSKALKSRGGSGWGTVLGAQVSTGGPRITEPRGRLGRKAALPRHPRRPAARSRPRLPGGPPATPVQARPRGARLHLLYAARLWLHLAPPQTLTCAGSGLGAPPPPSSARSPPGRNKA